MEIIYIILLVIIIYLLITNKSDYSSKIENLEVKITELQRLLRQNISNIHVGEKEKTETKPAPEIAKPTIKQPLPTVLPENIEWSKQVIAESKPVTPKPVQKTPLYYQPEPALSFFERYPDLEKFIGENLVNKIGIAILVLAIGFFVKYAIDNNWIGPVGRVGIGVLCGGILIAIAHRLRNSYKAFSSVLVGGGLAVLYFTITLAYHQFHLFSQTSSFIIMIVITAFAVILSLLYNKQELAVIALIGGLCSPFLVSNGVANYQALFVYLVILNTGLLIIAYYKSWRILNASAFALTVILVAVILFSLTAPTYFTGFIYATILYLLFFAINIANNVKENKKFIASDFTILLVNTGLYFAAGLYLLTIMHLDEFRGLFSAGLGIINLILSFLLFRNKKVDHNILYLLIGITLTFVSLTAPIQLHGHSITLFWSAEAVLLYWLYQKSGIKLMQLTSIVIWAAMLFSLLMDWTSIYGFSEKSLPVIFNKGFITTFCVAVSSWLLSVFINKDPAAELYGLKLNSKFFKYASYVFLFMSGLLEINHQFLNRYPDTQLNYVYVGLYMPLFIFIGYGILAQLTKETLPWKTSACIIVISICIYLLFTPAFFNVEYVMLVQQKVSTWHFVAHWAGVIFISLLFYRLIVLLRDNLMEELQNVAAWILSAAVILFLSVEVCLLCNLLFYSHTNGIDEVETVYIKVGLPILWGLASFALMWLGMRNKQRVLRIISLTLFSITLIKLFIFDIQGIPPAGKIAAFFCLGVLLLIISFMYQKVKKIIVDDTIPGDE